MPDDLMIRSVEDALKRFPELGRAKYGHARDLQAAARLTMAEHDTLQAVCKHWDWNYRQWVEYCLLRFLEQVTPERLQEMDRWLPPSPTEKFLNCLIYKKLHADVMAVLAANDYEKVRFGTMLRWALAVEAPGALATPPISKQKKMQNWERHSFIAEVTMPVTMPGESRIEMPLPSPPRASKVEVPGTDFDLAITSGKKTLQGLDDMLAAAQPLPKLAIVPPAPAQEAPATLLKPGDPMPLPFPDDIEDDYTGDA